MVLHSPANLTSSFFPLGSPCSSYSDEFLFCEHTKQTPGSQRPPRILCPIPRTLSLVTIMGPIIRKPDHHPNGFSLLQPQVLCLSPHIHFLISPFAIFAIHFLSVPLLACQLTAVSQRLEQWLATSRYLVNISEC